MPLTGYKSRVALVIQSSQVPADMTNFPVLLTKDNIPQEVYEADSGFAALNGGGDIRFSSDAAGTIQLPCEIGRFVTDNNPANADVEIWVKLSSISSATNTTFYMWYGKAGDTQPARNDAYGMENVWNSSYKAVWHHNEGWNTSANGFNESTASQKHGTGSIAAGSPTVTTIAGKWGGQGIRCINCTSPGNVYKIEANGSAPLNYDVRSSTWEAWVKSVDTQTGWCMGKGSDSTRNWHMRGIGLDSGDHKVWWNRNAGDSGLKSSGTLSNDTWAHIAATIASDGSMSFYLNGSASGTGGAGTITSENGTDVFRMGDGGGGDVSARQEPWKGNIKEVRLHNTDRSANYMLFEYRTMDTPETVIIEGTPVRLDTPDFFNFMMIHEAG